jgi:hypothetical protein
VTGSGLVMRAMWAPKEGSAESEWEDSAAYRFDRAVAAIADGASSSYRAANWSAELVGQFVSSTPDLSGDPGSFAAWVQRTADGFQSRSEARSETSWYAADASRRGSFATFCGLRLAGGPDRFEAVHVGDACLFHCRGGELVTASVLDPAGFDLAPDLLKSSPYEDSYGAEEARFIQAPIEPGDVIFLATDAMGSAMLQLHAVDKPVWATFSAIGPAGFDRATNALRAAGIMENDDVTLLRIRLPERPDPR